MTILPPAMTEAEFKIVEQGSKSEIEKDLHSFFHLLLATLNDLPSLRDVQAIRKGSPRPSFQKVNTSPQHWYTFSYGGRNEIQFNVGMFGGYVRIGIGLEPTGAVYGEPEKIWAAHARLAAALSADRPAAERFFTDNQIRIEWMRHGEKTLSYVPTEEALGWFLRRRDEGRWIFAGRLLHRQWDAAILGDPEKLAEVMERVFAGFRPYWDATQ